MTMAKEEYVSGRDVSVLERPRYQAGLLLEDTDLTAAVKYTRDMSRLLFRSLFGCGVICGLDVTALLTCNRSKIEVTIAPGIALDCSGNPIYVPKAFKVTYDSKCKPLPTKLWVTICYVEKCCGPRDISCSADDDGQMVQTRVIDGFEVRLYPNWPDCACSCLKPPEGQPSSGDECCDDEASNTAAPPPPPPPAPPPAPAAASSGADAIPEPNPPICECFYDHWNGKCDCECCCNCVFIAFVNVELDSHDVSIFENHEANPALHVDRKGVRWIRPMLVGYYKCPEAHLPAPPAPALPPPNVTPSYNKIGGALQQGKRGQSIIQKRPRV
jgi:hypothetical protein